MLFAILQKYEFSSKSQQAICRRELKRSCLRYCKSTSFQANHNPYSVGVSLPLVVCDTAKVRVFKQITTKPTAWMCDCVLFAILQKYEFSSKSQPSELALKSYTCCLRYCKSTSFQANHNLVNTERSGASVVCDTAKVRVFKQITTVALRVGVATRLFAILQKYEFSSKSQRKGRDANLRCRCLRYCKSTSFQANHNWTETPCCTALVVCDTAKVRVFKQITTFRPFANVHLSCLRYCKSTSFQANHNSVKCGRNRLSVVCDTAKVRVFKQITTVRVSPLRSNWLFAILQKYEFSSKSQRYDLWFDWFCVVCDTAKVRVFKQITTYNKWTGEPMLLFAILQKYEFSSKSQQIWCSVQLWASCLRYCKSTSFQANHNNNGGAYGGQPVVCDTAKVRVFKQITTYSINSEWQSVLFAILQKYEFSSKSQHGLPLGYLCNVVCDTAKVRVFKQITTPCVDWCRCC